jgi:4-amino-4-deoxy-L-arabinose transferase-like glycosyltransferase
VWKCARDFLYEQNDADTLLLPSRVVNVVVGLLLGLLLFAWAYELFGFQIAGILMFLFCFEPNILAHTRLVTTDMAYVCFTFGALYFLSRFWQYFSWHNVLGLSCFSALALLSKFSALILIPIIGAAFIWRIFSVETWNNAQGLDRRARFHRLLLVSGVLLLCSFVLIWGSYGFRYAPTSDGDFRFSVPVEAKQNAPLVSALVDSADAQQLLPHAYLQGFLRAWTLMNTTNSTYLLGEWSQEGWWYYYPLAFLFKTSCTLLVLFAFSFCVWRKNDGFEPRQLIFIWGPVALVLLLALGAKLNAGIRYLLIIYPLLILASGRIVAYLLKGGRRWGVGALVVFSALELAQVYPYPLTFFNGFIGGASQGHRYLVDSNLDWGQDLKALKTWMDAEGVEHINLSYFGTAKPEYYGISATHLRGQSAYFTPAGKMGERPKLPGWIAISVTNLKQELPAFYSGMLAREPDAKIKETIWLYYWDPAKDQK